MAESVTNLNKKTIASSIGGDGRTSPTGRLKIMSPRQQMFSRALRHGGMWIGGLMLAFVVIIAVSAPLLAPYDPSAQDLARRFAAPVWAANGSFEHLLGTDNMGRDIFSRMIWGARTSLFIGVFTVLLSGAIGTALGVAAGYFGGWVDLCVSFLVTVRLTLPVVLVSLVIVAVLGNSLTLMIAAIGCLLWDRFAIVSRSATQQLAHREYIAAARSIGSSTPRILWRELLPNIFGSLLVVASLELANAILIEASLSFLGLGVQPPQVSWGLMISEAKSQLLFRPMVLAIPAIALIWLVLSINLLGDGLRDVTTPEGRA